VEIAATPPNKAFSERNHVLPYKIIAALIMGALDAGDSAAFQEFFWLRVFSAPKHYPRPPQRQ